MQGKHYIEAQLAVLMKAHSEGVTNQTLKRT